MHACMYTKLYACVRARARALSLSLHTHTRQALSTNPAPVCACVRARASRLACMCVCARLENRAGGRQCPRGSALVLCERIKTLLRWHNSHTTHRPTTLLTQQDRRTRWQRPCGGCCVCTVCVCVCVYGVDVAVPADVQHARRVPLVTPHHLLQNAVHLHHTFMHT